MALNTPYITDKFTAYPGEVISTSLALAVWLIDEFTKKGPTGRIEVKIEEEDIKAVKNLSGYYFFTDLDVGNYRISIESDLYFHQQKPVDISTLDPKNPVIKVTLVPRPLYPFPNHATLVRGLVSRAIGPVVDADVEVVGKPIKSKTDERGEFVLHFVMGSRQEDITIKIKKNGDIKTVNTTIREGKTKSLGTTSFP